SVSPEDGSFLWEHEWTVPGMCRVIQPLVVPTDESSSTIFIGTGYGVGTRSILVTKVDDEWDIEENWTSRHLKPYFNDMVLYDGHIYGFDGIMFTCIDTETGKRKWKKRGYGHGQVLLLKDQQLLLILSESGELALVEAQPGEAKELAKMSALTGKTWNHPVIAHGKLFVRNGEEAVCYDLTN
ncbi:MAG: PQQ-binding-like beta-propeller repeat protein, partial [Planctomycetota bacterium]